MKDSYWFPPPNTSIALSRFGVRVRVRAKVTFLEGRGTRRALSTANVCLGLGFRGRARARAIQAWGVQAHGVLRARFGRDTYTEMT